MTKRSCLVLGVAVVSTFAFAAASGCTKPNPALCCQSAEDCAGIGLDHIKMCGAGSACDHDTCVPSNCTLDSDCPAEHPACQGGLCGDCSDMDACASGAPVCDLVNRTCGACGSNGDCSGLTSTPVCDSSSGACVQCTTQSDCSGTTPVCDGNSCRACTKDSDCPTLACAPDGSCVADANIVWMSPQPCQDSGTCTHDAPCCNFVYAVLETAPDRKHIVVMPGWSSQAAVQVGTMLTTAPELFVHGNGAHLTPVTGTSPPPLFYDVSLPLTLRNLDLSGRTGGSVMQLDGPVTLEDVAIHDAKQVFVQAPVSMRDVTITDSIDPAGAIVLSSAGRLTTDRAVISFGSIGVSAPMGSTVSLQNTLIYGQSGHALELAGIGTIDSCTIADAGAGQTTAPCAADLGTSVVNVRSSIFWSPMGCGGSTSTDAVRGGVFTSSIVSNLAPPAGATHLDPNFKNEAAHDYHIQPSSPAKDVVDTGPPDDFEGDPRPQGAKFDIGADEAPP